MGRATGRAAALALMTRSSLLPRGVAAAGASAFTDLLLFERSMRRGAMKHAEGALRGRGRWRAGWLHTAGAPYLRCLGSGRRAG